MRPRRVENWKRRDFAKKAPFFRNLLSGTDRANEIRYLRWQTPSAYSRWPRVTLATAEERLHRELQAMQHGILGFAIDRREPPVKARLGLAQRGHSAYCILNVTGMPRIR